MQAKENMIPVREFTEPFYHRLLDVIRWNSLELLIMYHHTIHTHRFQILFAIRDDYGTNTGRIRDIYRVV
jgi:hypothetical protein